MFVSLARRAADSSGPWRAVGVPLMDKQLAVVPREESRAVVLSGLSAVVHLLQIQIERRAVPSQICLESLQAWWVASRSYPSGLVG